MKKKPGKYLKFYYECMEAGRMPTMGLCSAFNIDLMDDLLDLFNPNFSVMDDENYGLYWGHQKDGNYECSRHYTFTERRQTIVLLMAAMAGEL